MTRKTLKLSHSLFLSLLYTYSLSINVPLVLSTKKSVHKSFWSKPKFKTEKGVCGEVKPGKHDADHLKFYFWKEKNNSYYEWLASFCFKWKLFLGNELFFCSKIQVASFARSTLCQLWSMKLIQLNVRLNKNWIKMLKREKNQKWGE